MRHFALFANCLIFVLVNHPASADWLIDVDVELEDHSVGSFSYVLFDGIIEPEVDFTSVRLPGPDRKQGTNDDLIIDGSAYHGTVGDDVSEYFFGEIQLLSVSDNLSPNGELDNKQIYWGYFAHNRVTSCQDYFTDPLSWTDLAGSTYPGIDDWLYLQGESLVVVHCSSQTYDHPVPAPEPVTLSFVGVGISLIWWRLRRRTY